MDKNAISMRMPVDRFMGLAELRDDRRWQDEYEAFEEAQTKARLERPRRAKED